MTVLDLRDKLWVLVEQGLGDAVVLKSSDDEGNSFMEVDSIESGKAVKEKFRYHTNWEVKHPDDWADCEDLEKIVCLW